MQAQKISLSGAADLRELPTLEDVTGQKFPLALSWAIPTNPQIMVGIQHGPNQAYADEYARANDHINEVTAALGPSVRHRRAAAHTKTNALDR